MSTKPLTKLSAIVGLVAGVATVTALVAVAHAMGNDSFAKGMAIGGGFTILALGFLFWRGARGGAPARIASGNADEREQRILRDAFADAGIAMFVAGVAMTFATLWDVEAEAVGAIILGTGILTFLITVGVRARRS
jgi:hypothetical protein